MATDVIQTERLILRPFREADIPEIVTLLNDPVIAETTLNIPFPYDEAKARDWLTSQNREREAKTRIKPSTLFCVKIGRARRPANDENQERRQPSRCSKRLSENDSPEKRLTTEKEKFS